MLTPPGGDRNDLSIGRSLLAGGLGGVCNWLVALPPDVLKSRLQSGNNILIANVQDLIFSNRRFFREKGKGKTFVIAMWKSFRLRFLERFELVRVN